MTAVDEGQDLTPAERFLALSPEEQEAVLRGDTTLEALEAGEPLPEPEDADYDDEDVDDEDSSPRIAHFRVDPEEEATLEGPDSFQFTLGREHDPVEGAKVLTARRPKTAVLMRLAVVDPNSKDIATIVRVVDTFLDNVLDRESRDYIRGRFDDPDDDWDFDLVIPVINACKARWYGGRPTGRATGSSGSPSSRGKRSTGRSRSQARRPRKG